MLSPGTGKWQAHLLQVARGACGDLWVSKDDLLSRTASQGRHNAGKDLLLGEQAGVLAGNEPGQALGLPTGDECDLLYSVMTCHPKMQGQNIRHVDGAQLGKAVRG